MDAQILFQGCTFQQLAEATAAILSGATQPANTTSEAELITREEVCKLLNFNKTTLHKHTKSGRLKSYGIGARVLYKRSEVLASVTPLKR